MDQPYSRMADMMLDTQFYNSTDTRPYDDTGWSLGPLRNVRTTRITDPAILKTPMEPLNGPARVTGKNCRAGTGGRVRDTTQHRKHACCLTFPA